MPTRNYTVKCGGKTLRVTTCEGAVSMALVNSKCPDMRIMMTSEQAVAFRDLLALALKEDPFTLMSANQ